MKILVCSDSHHSLAAIYQAIEHEKPDQVIHLGDCISDCEKAALAYPRLPFAMVPGNCDGWTMEPVEKCISFSGKTILFSHGHTWRVKTGFGIAVARAKTMNADILLFGHTHQAVCYQHDDLWILNPGASPRTYGVIEIEPDKTNCYIVNVD